VAQVFEFHERDSLWMIAFQRAPVFGWRDNVVKTLEHEHRHLTPPDVSFGGGSALVEYFANPAAEDRAARALAFDGAQILGLGDFKGATDRDAFLFRLGGNPDGLFADGFEG
jgi:hypothetical protein